MSWYNTRDLTGLGALGAVALPGHHARCWSSCRRQRFSAARSGRVCYARPRVLPTGALSRLLFKKQPVAASTCSSRLGESRRVPGTQAPLTRRTHSAGPREPARRRWPRLPEASDVRARHSRAVRGNEVGAPALTLRSGRVIRALPLSAGTRGHSDALPSCVRDCCPGAWTSARRPLSAARVCGAARLWPLRAVRR